MNYNYVPKQPIVQAFQLTKERWEDRSDWPWWLTEEDRWESRELPSGVRFYFGWVPWEYWIVHQEDRPWEILSGHDFAKRYVPYLGQRGSFGTREE